MRKPKLDQTRTPLLSALQACAGRKDAPFYTPGHKRGRGVSPRMLELIGKVALCADLPELPELDHLFAAQGVIQDAQELAADAFGSDRTWFLVNGSTCGVIAAILATCNPGEKIILPRNVHQSAISGLILSGAIPIFVTPEYDPVSDIAHSITPAAVADALEHHPDARAVMIVYPTYYGVCGDIAAIAQIAHQHGIPLLVDEAHGPHFAFHPDLPIAALVAEADLTVQSTHKVLSAITQAGMLHVQGDRIDRDRLSKSLQIVQSTSPNYLLLASLDAARHQMATQGKDLMEQTLKLADEARSRISQIPRLSILSPNQAVTPGFTALDRTRLTVTVSDLGMTGCTADEILNQQFCVVAELPSLQHLTFIISLGNTREDIEQLVQAFETLVEEQGTAETRRRGDAEKTQSSIFNLLRTDKVLQSSILTPRAACFAPTEILPIHQTINRISAELVCPYPPGIPVLIPGEVISEDAIAYLQYVLLAGGIISGCADPNLKTLRVVIGKNRAMFNSGVQQD
ncbi:MAG: aminotransferase class I/II-fold pyridoxal phosphate-dependent enzyme [Leptolyngbyaceae cyanobacterium RU_5_1]|nr:aminotransferase class I/II-fold pyridoxal phosphate-dependent enzyme [Leptolyngbyaceae cyanobacterium RU_5_1]